MKKLSDELTAEKDELRDKLINKYGSGQQVDLKDPDYWRWAELYQLWLGNEERAVECREKREALLSGKDITLEKLEKPGRLSSGDSSFPRDDNSSEV